MANKLSSVNKPVDAKENSRPSLLQKPAYTKTIRILFYIFAAYLVIPVVDVPLLGLSLSAPLFFVITLECVLKPPYPWARKYQGWIFLAIILWVGIFISAAVNGLLSGGLNIDQGGILTVVRFAYWLLVFVITAYLTSRIELMSKLILILGLSVLGLALLRWVEVILYGNVGAWTGTRFMSQNNYGILFSIFSPFLLVMMFQHRGWKRGLLALGNLILWGAAGINGSRGSWVAILVGLALCFLFFVSTQPRRFLGLLILFVFIAGLASLIWAAFPQMSNVIESRLSTFNSLDDEKSFKIRELMIQKGIKLFQENPIFGVGPSRFTKSSVPLQIPQILSYANQDYFDLKSAHNSYIGFLAETGLVGAIPFGFLLIILTFRGIKVTFKTLSKGNYLVLPVFLGFMQMSIHMWVISSLTNTGNWFIYGLVAGSIMLYRNLEKSECA